MDRFIPIIIIIVIFALRAYANFKKEQEKARKRNPNVPPLPPLPEDNAEYIKPAPAPVPAPVPSTAAGPDFEQYSGVINPGEPTRARREYQPAPLRLEVDTETAGENEWDAEEFDLRDAVIKSVILERPYK